MIQLFQVTFFQLPVPKLFLSPLLSSTALLSIKQNCFLSYCLSVFWRNTVGRITTRCLICLATGCVTPLCIHYSLKYRTSMSPASIWTQTKYCTNCGVLKQASQGERVSFSFMSLCICLYIYMHNIFLPNFHHSSVEAIWVELKLNTVSSYHLWCQNKTTQIHCDVKVALKATHKDFFDCVHAEQVVQLKE